MEKIIICSITFFTFFSVSVQVQAFQMTGEQLRFGHDKHTHQSQAVISAREIADRIKTRYPRSKIIDIQQSDSHFKGMTYLVKLLTLDGRRIDVLVDARNGAVIEERGR